MQSCAVWNCYIVRNIILIIKYNGHQQMHFELVWQDIVSLVRYRYKIQTLYYNSSTILATEFAIALVKD